MSPFESLPRVIGRGKPREDVFRATAVDEYVVVVSEPVPVFTETGCYGAVDVIVRGKTQRMFLAAGSLARPLMALIEKNGGKILGIEFLVRKADVGRYSRYIVTEVVKSKDDIVARQIIDGDQPAPITRDQIPGLGTRPPEERTKELGGA